MKSRKHTRPQVESLESLALLSGAGVAAHAELEARLERRAALITPAPLSGTINGTYIGIENRAQTSASYRFYGVGRVEPIGSGAINGSVQLSNLVTTNSGTSATVSLNTTDDLYLRGRQGSLTLQIAAPTSINTAGNSNGSAQLTTTYTVTGATGAYQSEEGEAGTVSVSLRSYLPSFVHISTVDVGHFALTFSAPSSSTTTTSTTTTTTTLPVSLL